MTIQAIVFDFGGVLVRTQSWAPRHKWDDILGLAHGTIEHTVFNSERGRAAQHGVGSENAHWAWCGTELGLSAEQLVEFRHDFWAGDALDETIIAHIQSLRPKFRSAIISNAMDGLRADLADKWGIRETFDRVVVSAEFGTMKPEPSIYKHCLEVVGVSAENAVFIDDFQHNIDGAKAVGMQGIHYPPSKTTADLIAELAALGVK